jgi:molybdate transport system substrate-binding protein
MDAAVVVLIPQFEKTSGHKVSYSYDPSGGLARRLRGGEFADMILVASPELDKLIADGKVIGPRVDISRTGIGVAVKKGAPRPDVSTPEALKRALLAAKSVGHTAPAGGGITALHILRVFEKLGIAKEVATKTKLAAGGPNGRVSTLIVNGEAEIAFQQVSELMTNPDVEVIGMLPDELQQITINSAAITAVAKEPDAARALIKYLTSPEETAVYKKTGLAL